MLLELLKQGSMTEADLDASIPAIRTLLKSPKENTGGFQSIRQAMQGTSIKENASALKSTAPHVSSLKGEVDISYRGATPREIKTIKASELSLTPVDTGPLDVPRLSYGLERVLFNAGVYQLQDPRSKVFNFDPYLQEIMPVNEFDFNALKAYVTSSKDHRLMGMARQEKMKYTGSTSSMTSALGHFHFLLSQWRPINPGILSRDFPVEFESFTQLQRGPTAIFLRHSDGVYAIDADKEFDSANILSSLGKSMEKLLTLPTNDFERYRKPNSSQITEEERNEEEAFHYTTMGDFLMRSQLDAHDPRLPGTGMFDLKTRAVVAIRMDTSKYEEGSGYEIRSRFGEYESYEREYYDMIRSAFLKYSLQVRMGRMDGIFVAYHNTERIFGFQYVSLPEMDYALHGTYDTAIGDSEFKLSVELLNRILDRATAKYPGKSLRMFFETRPAETPFMYIFVEPVDEKDIEQIQSSNKSEIEEFEARVLGLTNHEEEQRQAEWEDLHSNVEQEMDLDEDGIERNSSLEEIGSDHAKKHMQDFINAAAQEDDGEDDDDGDDLDEGEEDEEDDDSGEEENDEDEDDESDEEGDEEDEGDDDDGEEEEDDNDESEHDEEHELDENADETFRQNDDEANERDKFSPDKPQGQVTEASGTSELHSNGIAQGTLISKGSDQATQDIQASDNSSIASSHAADHKPSDTSENKLEGDASAALHAENTSSVSPDLVRVSDSALAEAPKKPEDVSSEEEEEQTEVFAMTLMIRNKVNGKYVTRPENLTTADDWQVEYSLAEVDDMDRARKLYNSSKTRRSKVLNKNRKDTKWNSAYSEKLMSIARKTREWRGNIEKKDRYQPKKVLDSKSDDENKNNV